MHTKLFMVHINSYVSACILPTTNGSSTASTVVRIAVHPFLLSAVARITMHPFLLSAGANAASVADCPRYCGTEESRCPRTGRTRAAYLHGRRVADRPALVGYFLNESTVVAPTSSNNSSMRRREMLHTRISTQLRYEYQSGASSSAGLPPRAAQPPPRASSAYPAAQSWYPQFPTPASWKVRG